MKVDTMSRNVVRVITALAKNEGLMRLLINDCDTPLSIEVNPDVKKEVMKPSAEGARIFPYPFDTEAVSKDSSSLRVYYNDGSFNGNETVAESDMHIDIIVARSLWLIYDDTKKESLIRPYEMMDRIIDMIGRRSTCGVKLEVAGFQHHYVNTKFDCLRIYCTYTSIETMQQKDR